MYNTTVYVVFIHSDSTKVKEYSAVSSKEGAVAGCGLRLYIELAHLFFYSYLSIMVLYCCVLCLQVLNLHIALLSVDFLALLALVFMMP